MAQTRPALAGPSFYPLAPCPSCAVPSGQPVQAAASISPALTISPSETMHSDPCEDSELSLAGEKSKHWKHKGGLSKGVEGIIRLFIELLTILLKLLGGSPITAPQQPAPLDPTDETIPSVQEPSQLPMTTSVPALPPCNASPSQSQSPISPAPLPSGPAPSIAGQATYYVAPTGKDTNPGTLQQPFATITKARDVVRTQNKAMTGNINVVLRGGTYTLTAPLTLESQDSGMGNFFVRYMAYPGERPVISGGVPVGNWTAHDSAKNIWKANVGTTLDSRGFFVNGKKAIRARTTGDWPTGYTKTTSGFTAPNSSMSTWGNKTAIEFVSDHDSHFYRCRVSAISGTSVSLVQPCWDTVRVDDDELAFDKVRWIENAYELIDTEGEWYLDHTAGILYYKPRSGENMATAKAVAAGIQTIVSGNAVSNLQFSGLTFAYTGFNDPNANTGYAGYQQGHYPTPAGADKMIPGGLIFNGSKNITFDRNIFAMMGGVGLTFDLGSQNNTITGNVFERIGNNAINLGNFASENPAANLQTRNFTIANNYIHLIGDDFFNSAGIWGGYVADIKILHNEVHSVPQKGIAIGWGWGSESYASNNKIQFNYLHETTKELHDSGAIYTLSPQTGTEINNNYVLNDVNRFNCLYPDEGTAFTNWHHNVCSQVGQWLHIWTDSIHDNKVQFNYSDTETQENAGTNDTVDNNTFITNGQWPAEAQTIMKSAGIEASYQNIKSVQVIP